jgi:hypothetical protein
MKQIITITLITFFSFNLNAINVKNMPRTIVQPDGTKIECFITGDEFGGMIHDAEGYAIKYDKKTGWWYYAVEKDGKVVCSEHIAGKVKPKEKGFKKGIFDFNEDFYKDVTERRKENKGKFKVSGGVLKSIPAPPRLRQWHPCGSTRGKLLRICNAFKIIHQPELLLKKQKIRNSTYKKRVVLRFYISR